MESLGLQLLMLQTLLLLRGLHAGSSLRYEHRTVAWQLQESSRGTIGLVKSEFPIVMPEPQGENKAASRASCRLTICAAALQAVRQPMCIADHPCKEKFVSVQVGMQRFSVQHARRPLLRLLTCEQPLRDDQAQQPVLHWLAPPRLPHSASSVPGEPAPSTPDGVARLCERRLELKVFSAAQARGAPASLNHSIHALSPALARPKRLAITRASRGCSGLGHTIVHSARLLTVTARSTYLPWDIAIRLVPVP